MSDKPEMNEKELEQVAGGFDGYEVVETRYNFVPGDTFMSNNGTLYYVALDTVSGAGSDTMIWCYLYTKSSRVYEKKDLRGIYVGTLVGGSTFIGNGVINESNIKKDDEIGIDIIVPNIVP